MATEYASGYCKNCEEDKKIERKAPNHILHFLITVVLGIFTGIGAILWIVIWIAASIKFGGWMCSTCGSKSISAKTNYFKMGIYIVLAILLVTVMPNLGKKTAEEKQSFINYILDNDDVLENAVLDKKELHITIDSNSDEFIRTSNYAEYICDKINRTSHKSMLPLKINVRDMKNPSYYQLEECN